MHTQTRKKSHGSPSRKCKHVLVLTNERVAKVGEAVTCWRALWAASVSHAQALTVM